MFPAVIAPARQAQVSSRLRKQAARLRAMATPLILSGDAAALLRQAYWHGDGVVTDQLLLHGGATAEKLAVLEAYVKPVFPVSGDDLIKCGHAPGPRLGDQLNRLQQWWVEQNFLPDKAACLAYVKTLSLP